MSEFFTPDTPKRPADADVVVDGHLFQAWKRRGEIQVVVRADDTKKSAAVKELGYPKGLHLSDVLELASREWKTV